LQEREKLFGRIYPKGIFPHELSAIDRALDTTLSCSSLSENQFNKATLLSCVRATTLCAGRLSSKTGGRFAELTP
jgi:hypothetical protein